MKLSDINPHIRYAKYHLVPTRNESYSICYDCRVFYFETASGALSINGEKYNFSNGDLVYLPPKTRYRFIFNPCENFKIAVINFDLVNDFSDKTESFGTATDETFSPDIAPQYEICAELSAPIIRNLPGIRPDIIVCTDAFLKKPLFFRERASAFLKLCLLELVRKNHLNSPYSRLCEKVLAYIHENYNDFLLTNEKIAEKFNYHPYHLSRIIKQQTGKTLHQYVTYYRVRIAKNLLVTTEYDIEEISWRTGFSSSAYFIKTFRLDTGMTPGKYRKLNFQNTV